MSQKVASPGVANKEETNLGPFNRNSLNWGGLIEDFNVYVLQ